MKRVQFTLAAALALRRYVVDFRSLQLAQSAYPNRPITMLVPAPPAARVTPSPGWSPRR